MTEPIFKCKVWDKVEKVMGTVTRLDTDGYVEYKLDRPVKSCMHCPNQGCRNPHKYVKDGLVLRWWSGRTNSKGIDIYDGDWIRTAGTEKIRLSDGARMPDPWWEVSQIVYRVPVFRVPMFRKVITRQHNSFFGELPAERDINDFAIGDCEVIGNAWENPDIDTLLESRK